MPSPIYERRAREARKLIDDGYSVSYAAEKVGVSKVTLRTYMNGNVRPNCNFYPPVFDPEEDVRRLGKLKAAKKFRECRFSYWRISRLIGASPNTVYEWRDDGIFKDIEKEYEK